MEVPLKRLVIMGCVLMISFGVYLITLSHDEAVYPLDEARGILFRIQTTSDPLVIHNDLRTVKELLPKTGNPVLVFPTDSTDFALIQKDLDDMLWKADEISNVTPESTEFHTGMYNEHMMADVILRNLLDASPYMYANLSFVFACLMCIIGSMGLAELFTRK